MKKRKGDTSQKGESPSRLIDERIKDLGDWRRETLSRIFFRVLLRPGCELPTGRPVPTFLSID